MSKQPNKMGRIEAPPKPKRNWHMKTVGKISAVVGLIGLGVFGTLQYQNTINNIKEQGAAEYRLDHCKEFTDKDKKLTWLECDGQ